MSLPPRPRWTRVNRWEWIVTTIKASGNTCAYRVVKNNFSRDDRGRMGQGRRQWWVIEDGQEPWLLAASIADAEDEFLLAFHGWRRPFGFVDGDGTRPIYGKGQLRRERADILAEIKAAYRQQRKAAKR
jgi:hypothetical protein